MMKKRILLLFLPFLTQGLSAQIYHSAAGLRLGGGVGMSYKTSVSRSLVIEGIAQRQFANPITPTTLAALVQRNQRLGSGVINGYYGIGGHRTWTKLDAAYGLDGIVGIEGTLFYLNTSLDFRPYMSFVANESKKVSSQVAVSVRYVLKDKKNKREKRRKESPLPPYKPVRT